MMHRVLLLLGLALVAFSAAAQVHPPPDSAYVRRPADDFFNQRPMLLFRGSVLLGSGLAITYAGAWLAVNAHRGDDEEFGDVLGITLGSLGVGLVITGVVFTGAGVLLLARGLRPERRQRLKFGLGLDATGTPAIRLRARW